MIPSSILRKGPYLAVIREFVYSIKLCWIATLTSSCSSLQRLRRYALLEFQCAARTLAHFIWRAANLPSGRRAMKQCRIKSFLGIVRIRTIPNIRLRKCLLIVCKISVSPALPAHTSSSKILFRVFKSWHWQIVRLRAELSRTQPNIYIYIYIYNYKNKRTTVKLKLNTVLSVENPKNSVAWLDI